MPFDRARIAFGPEALSRFTQIVEEVTVDLVEDGLTAEFVRSDEMPSHIGLGTSIVEALAYQLEATVEKTSGPQGTAVTITASTVGE